MTILGIGPIISSAMVAAIGSGRRSLQGPGFRCPAWAGNRDRSRPETAWPQPNLVLFSCAPLAGSSRQSELPPNTVVATIWETKRSQQGLNHGGDWRTNKNVSTIELGSRAAARKL